MVFHHSAVDDMAFLLRVIGTFICASLFLLSSATLAGVDLLSGLPAVDDIAHSISSFRTEVQEFLYEVYLHSFPASAMQDLARTILILAIQCGLLVTLLGLRSLCGPAAQSAVEKAASDAAEEAYFPAAAQAAEEAAADLAAAMRDAPMLRCHLLSGRQFRVSLLQANCMREARKCIAEFLEVDTSTAEVGIIYLGQRLDDMCDIRCLREAAMRETEITVVMATNLIWRPGTHDFFHKGKQVESITRSDSAKSDYALHFTDGSWERRSGAPQLDVLFNSMRRRIVLGLGGD